MNETKRVIALGFFDGVHNGHAALMRRTVQVAQEIGATPSAFTFDPHPQTVILGKPHVLSSSQPVWEFSLILKMNVTFI
ncbi:MAG: hypothetical protein IIU74_07970 [Ruminiclostridium sp.]|nr:hypothetical protein [Ruminiclostridium sp.]